MTYMNCGGPAVGVAVGDGAIVGVAVGFGDGETVAVAVGDGEAGVGDGEAASVADDAGVGVGVDAPIGLMTDVFAAHALSAAAMNPQPKSLPQTENSRTSNLARKKSYILNRR